MKKGRKVSMITLCPTRELARQVEDEISQIAKPLGLFSTVLHGGVSYDPQVCYVFQFRRVMVLCCVSSCTVLVSCTARH